MRARFIGLLASVFVALLGVATPAQADPPPAGQFRLSHHVCGAEPPGFARPCRCRRPNPRCAEKHHADGVVARDHQVRLRLSVRHGGAGQTIAIVDAYDDPTAEKDLGVFSSTFGLSACTTANGCFKKVNQSGADPVSRVRTAAGPLRSAWMSSGRTPIAPGAKILLVEASSNSFTNLLAAEDYARQHAQYVSNSWGGSEFSGETTYDSHFVQSGVSFFVSSGDAGLPAEYPSASPNVISVGGTTLHFNASGTFSSETGWSSGGGGCSTYETAPAAQSGFSGYAQVNCATKRATPDVALDADPASGCRRVRHHHIPGQLGLVHRRRYERVVADVGRARRRRRGAPQRRLRLRQQHQLPRHHQRQQRRALPTGYDLCSGRGSWIGNTP